MEDYIKILLGFVLFGLAAATGRPALMIVILGIFVTILYYLSMISNSQKGEGMIFSSPTEVLMALDNSQVHLQAKIKVRVNIFDIDLKLIDIVKFSY